MKLPERNADAEKQAFARRLNSAISGFDKRFLSATALAKEFNRRSKHSTVSTTGATNWLTGVSIPQQSKLVVLATWLDVDVNWLRYGDLYEPKSKAKRETNRHRKLVDSFSALTDRDKVVIEKMIHELLRTKA